MSSPTPFVVRSVPARAEGSRGAALIVVLAMLLLMTIMVLTFFADVAGEYEAAQTGSEVQTTRQLGDAAVQIVMGQIRAGTSQPGSAWASQPGMIRTYGNDGQPKQVFALYSNPQMIRNVGVGGFSPSIDLPAAGWAANRAQWVDLNVPAQSADGTMSFPVIDPRAATILSGGHSLVEGFSYSPADMDGAALPATATDANARLPMPVRWIYVLDDGQLATPTGGTGNTATFSGPGPVPSVSNPIVGRIAFWTDDETCKININTACGGIPWDTPMGNSGLELLLARYQPAKNEFSRYPGHPATVSVAPVFWSHLGLTSADESLLPTFTPDWNTGAPMTSGPTLSGAGAAFRDKVFPMVPRNTWGGSQMATRATAEVYDGTGALAAVDADRLFSSTDELFYGPNENSLLRPGNPLSLTSSQVALLEFFLTAQSRSPEVNPFNLPKIVLWPLPDATRKSVQNTNALAGNTRSPLDKLIAFCGTLSYSNGGKKREYGFTRYDANSAVNDFVATDAEGTKNNEILYQYLENLLGRPLPGFGGNFSTRYGGDGTRQILAGVFDFIRSQINLVDTSNSASNPADPQNLSGAFVSRYAFAASLNGTLKADTMPGRVGQVIPTVLSNGARGSGRFPVVSQVAIQFIARAANQPAVSGNPMHPWVPDGAGLAPYPTIDIDSNAPATIYDAARPTKFHTHPGLRYLTVSGGAAVENPRYRGPDLASFESEIEPTVHISFALPGAGVPGYRHPFRVRVRGLNNLRANGSSLFSASYDAQIAHVDPGGSGVWQFNVGPSKLGASKLATDNTKSAFFVGIPVRVGTAVDSGATFPFQGGDFEIELLHPADNSVVQVYKLTFPPATFPTPLLPHALPADIKNRSSHSFWSASTKPAFPPVKEADLPPSTLLTFNPDSELAKVPNFPAGVAGYVDGRTRRDSGDGDVFINMVLPEWPVYNDYRGKLSSDTVKSLEAAYGDARLLTQLGVVTSSFFLPHRFYYDTKLRAAHSFRDLQTQTQFAQIHGATFQYLTASSVSGAASLPSYGGAWIPGAPDPGNLWDVATGEDVKRLTYNVFVMPSAAMADSTVPAKWPFTASTCEFDGAKFASYKNSGAAVSSLKTMSEIWDRGGDFTSGIPGIMDGPMIGKVDEGNNRDDSRFVGGAKRGVYPYFNELATTSIMPVGPNLFSPNRQVPSPVVLGSVPAGYSPAYSRTSPKLDDITPWRTLLFSPNPVGLNHEALAEVSTSGVVPQSGKAPDFTLLDFFWMPVVEPYAISEPFSTAGKVNMNSQIAPFTYITRETPLRGVLRSAWITAVPDKWINNKNTTGSGAGSLTDIGGNSSSIGYANFRYPIKADETLKQFQVRFSAGDLFRSPSEICSLWLYPDKRSASDTAGPAWDAASSAIKNWWYADPGIESKSATGDNLREKPYAALYPLLTTKSNTYTVHFKVQTLKKVIGTSVSGWDEGRDRVTGELQGSQTIERYIDASDASLPDFASNPATTDLGNYYRFRILNNKRFTP